MQQKLFIDARANAPFSKPGPGPAIHTRSGAPRPGSRRRVQPPAAVASPELKAKDWWRPPPKAADPLSGSWVTPEARAALRATSPEQLEPVEAKVTGTIPAWLAGSFITNGGGDYTPMRHMFDGYALLCKLEVKGGRVFGTQRYLNSQSYRAYRDTGKVCKLEFGTTPSWNGPQDQLGYVWENMVAVATNKPNFTDNASVTLTPLPDGTLLALSEVKNAGYRVDPKTLETLDNVVLFNDGKPDVVRTAHIKPQPDGSVIGFSASMPLGQYCVYRMDPKTLQREVIALIPQREFTAAWMHDFAVTPNYAVLVEPPLFFSFPSLLAGVQEAEIAGAMDWKPRAGTMVYVVPLDGKGKILQYRAPPFFFFHVGNAYEREDGQYLYVELNASEDASRVNELFLDPLSQFPGTDSGQNGLRRLTIPLAPTGNEASLQESLLIPPQPVVDDDASHGMQAEFMTFNPAMAGKRHRYTYCCCMVRPSDLVNAMAKLDQQERRTQAVWHVPGCSVGEPVFVAAPDATEEDEGVLLFQVVLGNGNSGLVVLDAKTFEQLAIAELPYTHGYRFHGCWLPA